MSDLDEMELDVTLLHNKAFNVESLEFMKRKYYRYPDLIKEIDKQIKEKREDEYDR